MSMDDDRYLSERMARPKLPTESPPSHSLLIRAPLTTEQDHSDSIPSDSDSFLTGADSVEEEEEVVEDDFENSSYRHDIGGFVPKARLSGFDGESDEEEDAVFSDSEEEDREKRCLAVEEEYGRESERFESSDGDHNDGGEVMEDEDDGASATRDSGRVYVQSEPEPEEQTVQSGIGPSASTDSGGVDVQSVNNKPEPGPQTEEQTVISVEADSYPLAAWSTSDGHSYRGMAPMVSESGPGTSAFMDYVGVNVNDRPEPEQEDQTVIAVEADLYPSVSCSTPDRHSYCGDVVDNDTPELEPEPEEQTVVLNPSAAYSTPDSYCRMSTAADETCVGPYSSGADVESVNDRPQPEEHTVIAVETDSYPSLASSTSDSCCGMSHMIDGLRPKLSLDFPILKLDSIVGDSFDLPVSEQDDLEGGDCEERIVSKANGGKTEEQFRFSCSPKDSMATGVFHHLEHITCGIQNIIPAPADMDDDLEYSCNILLIGKTGVGKSALINSIFGYDITSISPFRPATTCVKEFTGTVDGVKLRVMDTPGLSSCAMDVGPNRKILTLMKKRMSNFAPDCVIYVDRLDDTSNDLHLLKLITQVLGASIWCDAIVLLTHADSPPLDEAQHYDIFVEKRYSVIEDCIWQAAGKENDVSLSLVLAENHHPIEMVRPSCLNWRPQLLLLCCSLKMVSQASCLMKKDEPSWARKFWTFLSKLVVHTIRI